MDLQPGDLTTLGKLPVGSVGEFPGAMGTCSRPFVVTQVDDDWVSYDYGQYNSTGSIATAVRYLGRGRIEPARIVLDSEPDRVRELEEQVQTLREAANLNLLNCPHAYERPTNHCPLCDRLRAALAVTAPKEKPCTT